MSYQFKIQLKEISKPPVWRRILISENTTFYDFHLAIQIAFGWENDHMFQFSPQGYRSYPMIKEFFNDGLDDFMERGRGQVFDAMESKLIDFFLSEKQKYVYIYDFGDDWKHEITLEKILPEHLLYPQVIGGKGQCPPEDCGGPWAYEGLKDILADSKHPDHNSMREWLGLDKGESWDTKEFDLSEKQELMLKVFSSHK